MGAAVSQTLSPDKLSMPLRLWSGMSTREIQGHLEEIYQVEVSPALISEVKSAVQEEVQAWQQRWRRGTPLSIWTRFT